jgi:hypothetical protein
MNNAQLNLQKMNPHVNKTKKKAFYDHRLSEAWIPSCAFLKIKQMLKVSELSSNTGRCMCVQWFPDTLKNCRIVLIIDKASWDSMGIIYI